MLTLMLISNSIAAYYIQITGASVLACPEIENNSYGEPSDQIFDDLGNAEDLRNFIRSYRNRRPVENFILDLGSDGPKTAIIFPPIIYGAGEGPVNQRSIQIPSLSRAALQQRVGLYLGKGLSRWGTIHVSDLGRLFADLAQHALGATEGPFWNDNGLYFAENGIEVGILTHLYRSGLETSC
jgi:nucleoside-diphosphate-sugar epimerase